MFLIHKNEPPKLSKPEMWSNEFNDFVAKCLVKEPTGRPSAETLLQVKLIFTFDFVSVCSRYHPKHPFLLRVDPNSCPALFKDLLTTANLCIKKHRSRRVALRHLTDDEFLYGDEDRMYSTPSSNLVKQCVPTVCRTFGLRKLRNELPSELYEQCVNYAHNRQ